jgi:hypothetical protein
LEEEVERLKQNVWYFGCVHNVSEQIGRVIMIAHGTGSGSVRSRAAFGRIHFVLEVLTTKEKTNVLFCFN